jgi:hypothetical protein
VNTKEKIINVVSAKVLLLIKAKLRNIKALKDREMSSNFSALFGGNMKGTAEEEE